MYFEFLGTKRHYTKQRILLKIALKICKSLVNFFKFHKKIVSVIGTVESANAYFSGGFADSRACIVLKKKL